MAALTAVFGVEPSYLLDRGEHPIDPELVEALRTKRSRRQHARSRTRPGGRRGLCWGSCVSTETRPCRMVEIGWV